MPSTSRSSSQPAIAATAGASDCRMLNSAGEIRPKATMSRVYGSTELNTPTARPMASTPQVHRFAPPNATAGTASVAEPNRQAMVTRSAPAQCRRARTPRVM